MTADVLVGPVRSRLPFSGRGVLSTALAEILPVNPEDVPDDALFSLRRDADAALAGAGDAVRDDDLQLALFLLYACSYGSLPLDPGWEFHPVLVEVRARIERRFEAALREAVSVPDAPEATADAVARLLFRLTAPTGGPSLSRYVAKSATREQLREFLIHRTVYTLREADPHSWAIPRLTGRAKAALVEIQSDEYGGGDPRRVHAAIFARTVRGAGLDDAYGAYVDLVPAITLASHNLMSMFGINRRFLGAVVGHLAAFEMTSSIPNRWYGDGFRRLGFGEEVTDYFDEHVEADAVHEQIAGRDLAGGLAEDRPSLLPDILFGAAACLWMDDAAGAHIHDAFRAGRTSLRQPAP